MVSHTNTVQGKALEYAVLKKIYTALKRRNIEVSIFNNPAFETAQKAFFTLSEDEQNEYGAAAKTAIDIIMPLEPTLVTKQKTNSIEILIQEDAKGQKGDVRDVICRTFDKNWEIGISCKHNHEALKHPRVTSDADFGTDWVGVACSNTFFSQINEVMQILNKWEGTTWSEHPNKHKDIYRPVINAFIDEIRRLCSTHSNVPEKLVRYFFGKDDFYKVIAKDSRKKDSYGLTKVMAFNVKGTLGRSCGKTHPIHPVKTIPLPSRLIEIGFKENSFTTLIMTFDKGWTLSMRLHNADKRVKETGLKWDIQLIGMPTGLYEQEQPWIRFA